MSDNDLFEKIEVRKPDYPTEAIERLRDEELRASALGFKDQGTTWFLRNYYLFGQEFIRETNRGKIKVVRALLDPQEYVIRVTNQGELVAQVQQDRQRQLETLRRILHRPELNEEDVWPWRSYEVVIGNPFYPETVYRYRLMNARQENGQLVLTVQGNIEHEKLEVFRPQEPEAEDEKKKLGKDKETKERLQVSLSDLTSEQIVGRGHPEIGIGLRTGRLITHQRMPEQMTMFAEDQFDIAIDRPEELWVVVTDAEAARADRRETSLAEEAKEVSNFISREIKGRREEDLPWGNREELFRMIVQFLGIDRVPNERRRLLSRLGREIISFESARRTPELDETEKGRRWKIETFDRLDRTYLEIQKIAEGDPKLDAAFKRIHLARIRLFGWF